MKYLIIFLTFIFKESFSKEIFRINYNEIDSIVVVKYENKEAIKTMTITNKDSIKLIINKFLNKNKEVYIVKARANYGMKIYTKNKLLYSISIIDKYFNVQNLGWHKMRRNVIKYLNI